MRKGITTIGLWAAGISMVAGASAQAAAPCWQDREISAARVRQMQTMLMVATLRCRAAQVDIVTDYDGFVRAQTDAIAAANLVIKQHFAAAGGNQADYDRFATSLANGYGDDETSQASCADAAALAHEASAAAGGGALDRIASARLFPAVLPGGACAAPVAPMPTAAAPAGPAIPLVMAEAPAAPPAPVTLPADVVAALTVMARYHDAQAAAPSLPAATQMAAVVR